MPPLTEEHRRRVEQNTGLVGFVLRGQEAEPDYDDRFQDGLFGLMRAAQKFEPERGLRFSTYAVQWIRAALQQGRANFEGCNYRRALNTGSAYVAPLSVDAPLSEDDEYSFLQLLPDRGFAPDSVAIDRAVISEARRAAEQACHDDLDRLIVAALFDSDRESLDSAVSRMSGYARQTITNRRKRLQRFLRARAQVAA